MSGSTINMETAMYTDKQHLRVLYASLKQRVKSQKSTYEGTSMCKEWATFEGFYDWASIHYVHTYHLDKDLKVLGNKEYGPYTCTYVPRYINTLLTDSAATRGAYPLGVRLFCTLKNGRPLYKAEGRLHGKLKSLGYYHCVDEAHKAWQVHKVTAIRESVFLYQCEDVCCPVVCTNLLSIADQIEVGVSRGTHTITMKQYAKE